MVKDRNVCQNKSRVRKSCRVKKCAGLHCIVTEDNILQCLQTCGHCFSAFTCTLLKYCVRILWHTSIYGRNVPFRMNSRKYSSEQNYRNRNHIEVRCLAVSFLLVISVPALNIFNLLKDILCWFPYSAVKADLFLIC